jgi:hypothetical protein
MHRVLHVSHYSNAPESVAKLRAADELNRNLGLPGLHDIDLRGLPTLIVEETPTGIRVTVVPLSGESRIAYEGPVEKVSQEGGKPILFIYLKNGWKIYLKVA